ncbi:hypothetical protein Tco_0582638 [Tanacetum coccineum]
MFLANTSVLPLALEREEKIAGLRYETGEKKVNEVDFISQGMELVVVVMKVVLECRHWKVVRRIEDGHVEEIELEWWFEQDIDVEEKEVEEDEDGGEV